METYQITAIRNAFKRCYGLRDGVKATSSSLASLWLQSLAEQTGLRLEYLTDNIEIIKEL